MSDYNKYSRLYSSQLDDHSPMLFMAPKPDSFPLGGVTDAQQSFPPSDLSDLLSLDTISPVLSPGYEVQLFDDDDHPFHGSSSLIASTPVTPGITSPFHPGYTSSPNLPTLTSPTPARTEHRPGPMVMVPQKRYKPHTSSDRRRYVDEVNLEPPINFYMQKPDEEGIPLKDAMHGRFARLALRDEPMFRERGPSISVRLNWPGYQPWSRQIPTRDFRNPPGPITRGKLAKNVAKSVARFIAEHKGRPMEEDGDPAWVVGPGAIDVFDLVLVRLDHVSKGCWQAQLQLTRPST